MVRRLALSILALAACTDLSGLSSSPAPGGTDGGADASTVPPPPSSTDGGTDDACAGDFCEPFEDPNIAQRWTDIVATSGTGVLDNVAIQGSSSLHVQTPPMDGGIDQTFQYRKYFSVPTSIRCSFAIRSERDPAVVGGSHDVFVIEATGPSTPSYMLRLGLQDGITSLREDVEPCGQTNCPRKIVTTLPTLPKGAWRRIEIETDFTTATVSYDGVVVESGAWVGFTPTTLAIRLGVQSFATSPSDVHYDDLVCTLGK